MTGFANPWSGSTLFPLSVTDGQPQLRAQAIDTFFYKTGPSLQRAKQEDIEGLEEGSANMSLSSIPNTHVSESWVSSVPITPVLETGGRRQRNRIVQACLLPA